MVDVEILDIPNYYLQFGGFIQIKVDTGVRVVCSSFFRLTRFKILHDIHCIVVVNCFCFSNFRGTTSNAKGACVAKKVSEFLQLRDGFITKKKQDDVYRIFFGQEQGQYDKTTYVK
jgi:hypothetical protein